MKGAYSCRSGADGAIFVAPVTPRSADLRSFDERPQQGRFSLPAGHFAPSLPEYASPLPRRRDAAADAADGRGRRAAEHRQPHALDGVESAGHVAEEEDEAPCERGAHERADRGRPPWRPQRQQGHAARRRKRRKRRHLTGPHAASGGAAPAHEPDTARTRLRQPRGVGPPILVCLPAHARDRELLAFYVQASYATRCRAVHADRGFFGVPFCVAYLFLTSIAHFPLRARTGRAAAGTSVQGC